DEPRIAAINQACESSWCVPTTSIIPPIKPIGQHMLQAQHAGQQRDQQRIELAADAVGADGAVNLVATASELIAAAAENFVEPLARKARQITGVAREIHRKAADDGAGLLTAQPISAGMLREANGHAA